MWVLPNFSTASTFITLTVKAIITIEKNPFPSVHIYQKNAFILPDSFSLFSSNILPLGDRHVGSLRSAPLHY